MGRDKILFAAIAIIIALAAFVVLDPLGDDGGDFEGTSAGRRPASVDAEDSGARRRRGAPGANDPARGRPAAGDVVEEAPPIDKKDVFGVRYAAVVGQVVDQDGAPIAGASVELHDGVLGIDAKRPVRGPRLAGVESREDGTFEFRDVEATRHYVLQGARKGFMRYSAGLAPEAGETLRIDVVLRSGLVLAGTVSDAETGDRLVGATVRVYDLGDMTVDPEDAVESFAVTDDEGIFAIADVAPGNKRLTASLDGFAAKTMPFVKIDPAAAAKSYDFELGIGLEISGEVADLDGRPLAGVSVVARPVQGGSLHPEPRSHHPATTTDREGRYVVAGLGEGLYAVTASSPGFRQGSFGVSADGDRPLRSKRNARAGDEGVDLVLGPAPFISGRVVDDDTGEPVPAFRLTFSRGEVLGRVPRASLRRVEHADGKFAYTLPPAATTDSGIWLHALAPGYAGGRAEVDFATAPGRQRESVEGVTIRLKRGVTVTGRVVDRKGRGVDGALVRVVPPHVLGPGQDVFGRSLPPDPNAGTSARTDADGNFVVTNVRPGEHFISVRHDSFAVLRVREPMTAGESGEIAAGELRIMRGGRVRGAVRAENGGGQEGAVVLLQAVDLASATPGRTVRTGLDGAFDFRHVAPGRYTVSVVAVGGVDFRATHHALKGVKPKTRTVTVEDDGEVEVVF